MKRLCLITVSLAALLVPSHAWSSPFELEDSEYGTQGGATDCTHAGFFSDSTGLALCTSAPFQTQNGPHGFLVVFDPSVGNIRVTFSNIASDIGKDLQDSVGLVLCDSTEASHLGCNTNTPALDVSLYNNFSTLLSTVYQPTATATSAIFDFVGSFGIAPTDPDNPKNDKLALLVLSNNADIKVEALPTPEPSSLLLLGTGAVVMFRRLRKRPGTDQAVIG